MLGFLRRYRTQRRLALLRERYKRQVDVGRREIPSLQFSIPERPRILLVLSRHGWQPDLEKGWQAVAETVCYDPGGYEPLYGDHRTVKRHLHLRKKWNDGLLDFCKSMVRGDGLDLIFIYTNANQLLRSTALALGQISARPTVLMSLDDRNSWEGPLIGGQVSGLRVLASAVSLYWTSARECLAWIATEGGTPMYLPEGGNDRMYKPVMVDRQDIDVCFVGAAYGFRKHWVNRLRKRGIKVSCFGAGWSPGSYVEQERIPEIYSRSKVVLGHGGVGYSETVTNVKSRDFEAPMTGGGVYVTTFNADLALHFRHGSDALFYRSDEECDFLIRWVLDHPEEARHIAERARERSLRMHAWHHRFRAVLDVLRGKLRPEDAWKTCAVSAYE